MGHLAKNQTDEDEAEKIQIYGAFWVGFFEIFPDLLPPQSSNFADTFTTIATFFNSNTDSTYPISMINPLLHFWYASARNITPQTWKSWNQQQLLPGLITKLLKTQARSSGSSKAKSSELVSVFISLKWKMLRVLVEKAQDFQIKLESNLVDSLFSTGLEVLDQADYESLPEIYNFLHTLLYRNVKAGEIPHVLSNEDNVDLLLTAAWKSFEECKRKTLPLIASFVGLIFHPVIFHVASEKIRYEKLRFELITNNF